MNPNREYEIFTQEVYQYLVNNDVVKNTLVQHDVKLMGRSGQEHQIDVYWEYEIAGNKHRVAIECKNYSKLVPIGKVRDFKGVLDDLNGVNGIMTTKVGYQEGAKKYAKEWGISLMELRTPGWGETIIGEIEFHTVMDVRHTLFKVDEVWADEQGFDFARYRRNLDMMRIENDHKWSKATHIPLHAKDGIIKDVNGKQISSLKDLEKGIPDHPTEDFPFIFSFDDAYVDDGRGGIVKILEVKFEYEHIEQHRKTKIDAEGFVSVLLKDALNDEVKFLG